MKHLNTLICNMGEVTNINMKLLEYKQIEITNKNVVNLVEINNLTPQDHKFK